MKKSIGNVVYLGLLILLTTSCKKEEEVVKQKGEVTFTFSALDNSGSRELEDYPVVAVLLSIEDAAGNNVYTLEEVELYKLNGQYVSKPLALEEGKYKLTEFMVVDDSKEIKFMTPITDSKKAYLVQASLPMDFDVSKDNVGKLKLEVLDIAESSPADFGYTTFFDFSIVKTFDFLVGVFVFNTDEDNYEMTQANIVISYEDEILYEGSIEAITNKITLRDGYDNYKLLIEKEGYFPYEETFTGETLKQYFESTDLGPLVIPLNKIGGETTMTLRPDAAEGKDVHISSVYSDRNEVGRSYFHAIAWTLNGSANITRGLLEFDLTAIPEDATILNAEISLFHMTDSATVSQGHYGDNESILQRITSSWDDHTVTWNTQPTVTTQNQVALPASTDPYQDYLDIDVTTLVQDMVNNPTESFGFLFRLKTEQQYRSMYFVTSDFPDATKHPKLIVTYK